MTDVLLTADYSALEVVVLADLTLRLFGDDQLANAIQPGAPDIHSVNARYIWGTFLGWVVPESFKVEGRTVLCPYAGKPVASIPVEEFKADPYGAFLRQNTKTAFYGWCYGKRGYGFGTLEDVNGKEIGEEVGNALCEGLMKAMPGLGFWERWVERFVNNHRGIYSLGGRWCDLAPEMESGEDWQRRRAYRRALNFPCQSSSAEIIGDAMCRVRRCDELRTLGYRTQLQIHDELVMCGPVENLPRARELLVRHMTEATANGTPLLVPLQASAGDGPDYYAAK
jgi:DNA polymerase I-like protein with 3'-5' exonuclease and polymerase domains